ncbi:MAG: extracellular solute-binding protein [Rhodospirillales bacterium]|nr:extracellular solute-binding protein [Rhodospirillales bacterium]
MSRAFFYRLIFAFFILVACAASPMRGVALAQEITVATWGGVYGEAMQEAIFKPFSRATGIGIRIHHHGSNYFPLMDGKAGWNVVDMERAPLTEGCAEGVFEKLDPELLLGKAASEDFLEGTLHPCGVGSMIWTQAVAFDATVFKGRPPQTLADFFDLNAFPGKRGLFAEAEGNLEIALMADGIPPSDVYDILRKPGGVDQALAVLDRVRAAAVFWRGGDEPEQFLNDGRVVMTTAYAARFLRPRQGARRPVKLMQSNQLWRATYWAIPSGQDRMVDAQRFVSFATDPERLVQLSARLWFGPARKSGFDAMPANIRDDLPTARRHFHDSLQIDSGFWAEFGPKIAPRFQAWRDG